ncbi:MAG: hypothetical protein QXJ21_02970 [Thermofilum sp.]
MVSRLALVKAGMHLWLSMYKHNKAALAAFLARPYLVLLFVSALGAGQNLVAWALLSILITSAVDSLWDIAGGAITQRLLGVLTYASLAPHRMAEILLLTYLPRYFIETLVKFAELAPLMVAGGATPAQLAAALALSLLGALPLASLGMLVSSLTLLAREDAPWIDWTIPLLLVASGAIYPVAALPQLVKAVSAALPTTYLFSMAEALATNSSADWQLLLTAFLATASAWLTASLLASERIESSVFRRGGHL